MASFKLISNDTYKVDGVLDESDIDKINSFKNRTTLILDNTVGLSSFLISKITSERIVFSIKGGLDYDTKKKYKDKVYKDRTYVSPNGLSKILKYFEYNESLLEPTWNDFEKAMFLYNALVVDMEYGEKYENIQSSGTTERSLNGILYSKLVCAGFALVYKEMLDRIGIKCYYQNQKKVHSFNVIEIDNKKYGVDVTWDNCDKKNLGGKCGFTRFGQDEDFYTRDGHKLYEEVYDFDKNYFSSRNIESQTEKKYDEDEEKFDLSVISSDDLKKYYSIIKPKIDLRKPFRYDLGSQDINIRNRYLPVDLVELRLKEETDKEYNIIVILDFLKSRNALKINEELLKAFSIRTGYILDLCTDERYRYRDFKLDKLGLSNYIIDRQGNLYYKDKDIQKSSYITGIFKGQGNISEDELNKIYDYLNNYLNNYFKNYILNILNNLDDLLDTIEYSPHEFDSDRYMEYTNINSKLILILNIKEYLTSLGIEESLINEYLKKIIKKQEEIYEPYQEYDNKHDKDIEFLSFLFEDLDLIRKTMIADLGRDLDDFEFATRFRDVDYMLELYEKYMLVGKEKFNLTEYDV